MAHQLEDAQISMNIGILIGTEAAYIAAMLACGKAGRCFVPLDIKLPDERLGYLLDKAEINTVLCLESTRSLLQNNEGVHRYCVDSYCFDDRVMKERFIDRYFVDNQGTVFDSPSYDVNPVIPVKGSDPCYVMFHVGLHRIAESRESGSIKDSLILSTGKRHVFCG
ncbi:AMP-binding protein [Vibrio sp. PP-XX7]